MNGVFDSEERSLAGAPGRMGAHTQVWSDNVGEPRPAFASPSNAGRCATTKFGDKSSRLYMFPYESRPSRLSRRLQQSLQTKHKVKFRLEICSSDLKKRPQSLCKERNARVSAFGIFIRIKKIGNNRISPRQMKA